MPLSMILPRSSSSGGNNAAVITTNPTTSIVDPSSSVTINGLTINKSAGNISLSADYDLLGSDGKYIYSYYGYEIYRSKLDVTTSGVTNGNSPVTQITDSSNSDGNYVVYAAMCNNIIYYLRYSSATGSSVNGQVSLYKYDTSSEKHTKVLANQLYRYTNLSYTMMKCFGIYSVSNRKIDNANYILFSYYRNGSDSTKNFLLIKDGESGGSVDANNTTAVDLQVSTSYTALLSETGIKRLMYRNTNFGIYNVIVQSSYTNVLVMITYPQSDTYTEPRRYSGSANNETFNWYVEKWKFSFASSGILQFTQISSTSIDNTKGDGNEMVVMPVSYPEYNSLLAITFSLDLYMSSDISYYTYLGHAFTAKITDSPTIQKLTSYTTNDIEKYDMNTGTTSSNGWFRSAVFYNGSDCPVLIVKGNGWSQIYPLTIDGTTSGSKGSRFHITWYFLKGDMVKCDAGIESYILGGTTYDVNSTSFTIPSNGTYEFVTMVYSNDVNPDFVVYTSDGCILNTGIKFINSNQISGYFNKGMKINGNAVSQSGYQTISGSFNGRVSITK